VKERTPVAFVQVGSKIALIDANGVVMDMPASGTKYSFPVIVGSGDAEPLSTRAARMKIYNAIVRDLDSDGAGYSRDLSEVDLSDPDDAKLTLADGNVLVHVGNGKYLDRYKVYVSHVQGWKQQYGALKSVDLRYEGQVIVSPEAELAPLKGTSAPASAAAPPAANVPSATKPAAAVATWKAGAPSGKALKSHGAIKKKARAGKVARVKRHIATTEE
jgi:cell division protein FtsQ